MRKFEEIYTNHIEFSQHVDQLFGALKIEDKLHERLIYIRILNCVQIGDHGIPQNFDNSRNVGVRQTEDTLVSDDDVQQFERVGIGTIFL